MEAVLGRSGHGGLDVKEEIKRVESNGDEEGGCKEDFVLKIGKSRHEFEQNKDTNRSSPKQKDLSCSKEENDHDRLESTRAEMGEVREENQRLKMYLGRIMKDYEALQMQFNNIVQQDHAVKKYSTDNSANNLHEIEETELVSLSLGSFSAPKINDEKNKIPSDKIDDGKLDQNDKQPLKEDLSLGLNNYKDNSEAPRSGEMDQGVPTVSNPSTASTFEEPKEEAGETWPPSKGLKAKRSAEDEVSQQNQVKRARVCVRAQCDTPTMNDGCQWRKYGQKIARGNPCPRAYYRCTLAPSCPVRKQVQRCANDMSILTTTYEGTHNHPLPVSAMAMASTTSAAASMLLSGSSTSSGACPPSTELHGLSTLDSSKWINNKQIYSSPYSSYSSFSSSHPTITLDLTALTRSSQSSSTSPFLNKFSSTSSSSSILPNYPHNNTTLYPSTSLGFGSLDSNTNNIMSWNNNINNGFLSYGSNSSTTARLYNLKSQIGSLASLGRQTTSFHCNNNNVNYYNNDHPSMQKGNSQSLVQESTIAAATKVITADPTFQSALAAALTSIIGDRCGGGQGSNTIQGGGDHDSNNNVVHQRQFPVSNTASFLQAAKGISECASTFLNKTASASNSQPAGNLMFLSPNSLSFSASKGASVSPGDGTREQTS